ncbi:MAG: hypothetical protein JWN67_4300, partial [Actinomycetia bacterium]|nr:hypothetical protein [Actinomycetes bacterium]
MSLRTRLTVLVAAVVAAAVIGGAVTSYYGTRHQLRAEVDSFLVQRVQAFDAGGGGDQQPGGDGRPGPGRHDGPPP